MSLRNASTKYNLPANFTELKWTRTDGNSKTWPTDTTERKDSDGCINWHRPVGPNEASSLRWRHLAGNAVAKSLGMSAGEYIMASFPDGYAMFDHNKMSGPGLRHDIYLFGSRSKFRSANEWIPHAIWLMGDPTASCACKYCTNSKSQKVITRQLAEDKLIISTPSQSGSSPSGRRRTPARSSRPSKTSRPRRVGQEHRVYAAVKPLTIPAPLDEEDSPCSIPMPRQKVADVRAVCMRNQEQKRWFREKEVLWCQLQRPIVGPSGKGEDNIIFWPGLVTEVKLVAERVDADPVAPAQNASPSQPALPRLTMHSGESKVLEDDSKPAWKVIQRTSYKIHLLGINASATFLEHMVLPHSAYQPCAALTQAVQWAHWDRADIDHDRISSIQPSPPADMPVPNFRDAVVAYSKAVVMAARLGETWSLTDEFEYRYFRPKTISPPPMQRQPQYSSTSISSQGASSLVAALGSAGAHNSKLNGSPVDDPNALLPEKEGPIVEDRYQGLWWGTERIWTGDLVRLKVDRRTIATMSEELILPPSGPSRSVLGNYADEGAIGAAHAQALNANTRGVFLKLDGMFVVENQQMDGSSKKECRVSGMLYELADVDWEEGQDDLKNSSTSPSHPADPSGSASAGPSSTPSTNGNGIAAPAFPLTAPLGTKTDGATTVPTDSYLSHPFSAPTYDLPEAPEDYKWRAIIKPGYEVHLSLSVIGGRYYPGLLRHPLLRPMLDKALDDPLHAESSHLWSLEGLAPGFVNAIEPRKFKVDRTTMLTSADETAMSELQALLDMKTGEKEGDGEDGEVDQLAAMDTT